MHYIDRITSTFIASIIFHIEEPQICNRYSHFLNQLAITNRQNFAITIIYQKKKNLGAITIHIFPSRKSIFPLTSHLLNRCNIRSACIPHTESTVI